MSGSKLWTAGIALGIGILAGAGIAGLSLPQPVAGIGEQDAETASSLRGEACDRAAPVPFRIIDLQQENERLRRELSLERRVKNDTGPQGVEVDDETGAGMECGPQCRAQLDRLISVSEVVDSRGQEAAMALALSGDPGLMRNFLRTLKETSDTGHRHSMLRVLREMPYDQVMQIAHALGGDTDPAVRSMSIDLYAGLDGGQSVRTAPISAFIARETDPVVLEKALESLDGVDPADVDRAALDALRRNEQSIDPKLRAVSLSGEALLGKAGPAVADRTVYGLGDRNPDVKLHALKAAQILLHREQTGSATFGQGERRRMEDSLQALADDDSAEPALRIRALSILEGYFSDEP